MKEHQFNKLIKYIDAAIADANAGPNGLHESVAKISAHEELHDSFFSNKEEEDILQSKIIQVLDQKKIIKEHLLFFDRLLNPSDLGWSVTEEVRNEARKFLGIPIVIIKKK